MNTTTIIKYLQDLINEILEGSESKNHLCHKIKILMSRLELIEKENEKTKKLKLSSEKKKKDNFSYFT